MYIKYVNEKPLSHGFSVPNLVRFCAIYRVCRFQYCGEFNGHCYLTTNWGHIRHDLATMGHVLRMRPG